MVLSPQRILAAGGATLAAGAAALALSGTPADAASTTVSANSVSANWAGYVAQGNNFSSVSGSWVQPSAKCTASNSYSAFWVGLGGASDQSGALEQVGTQANCSADGSTSYYAWYELVPAAPVKLDLAVKPGDHITGKVTVNGTTIVVALTNSTTGQSASKTLQTDNIDTSSAEWIAEAPSACDNSGACRPLSLADFGTVKFTDATATAGGHTGTITDSSWQATSVALDGAASGGGGPQRMGVVYGDAGGSGVAQASSLSSDGSAFTVAYQSASSTSTAAQSSGGDGGYPGGGYGDYGDGGYGYGGYGYGGGGYGYPGYGYDPGSYGYGSAGVTPGGSTASVYGLL